VNLFLEYLAQKEKPRALAEDEYLDEASGLVYCKKCRTPRQVSLKVNGRQFRPHCLCRCQSEALEAEKEEYRRRDRLLTVSRLKSAGLQDPALRGYTFANDSGINPEMEKAHAYVDHWPEMKSSCTGLLVWGGVGTGKTFLAGCIANALLEQGVPVLMTNFARILNALSGMFSDDRNRYLDSFSRYSLLIIDDLGAERDSEFALEQVFNVVDARCRSRLPLIVTTNLTLEELKHPADLAHQRIYDRVLERCVPLRINNRDIREQNRAENFEQARAILAGNAAGTRG
jgi:DNA replication protein DnaC